MFTVPNLKKPTILILICLDIPILRSFRCPPLCLLNNLSGIPELAYTVAPPALKLCTCKPYFEILGTKHSNASINSSLILVHVKDLFPFRTLYTDLILLMLRKMKSEQFDENPQHLKNLSKCFTGHISLSVPAITTRCPSL